MQLIWKEGTELYLAGTSWFPALVLSVLKSCVCGAA